MPPRRDTDTATVDEPELVPALVVAHAHNYTTLHPVTRDRVYNRYEHGRVIHVPREELERGKALGSLIDPPEYPDDDVEVARAIMANTSGTPSSMTDDQLRGMTAEELTAYVSQNPTELARVIELESTRGDRARPDVIALADSQVAQEAAMARAEEAAAREAERAGGGAGAGA